MFMLRRKIIEPTPLKTGADSKGTHSFNMVQIFRSAHGIPGLLYLLLFFRRHQNEEILSYNKHYYVLNTRY